VSPGKQDGWWNGGKAGKWRRRRGDGTVILSRARQYLVREHFDFKGLKQFAAKMRRA
jgi:hypothetical protein